MNNICFSGFFTSPGFLAVRRREKSEFRRGHSGNATMARGERGGYFPRSENTRRGYIVRTLGDYGGYY